MLVLDVMLPTLPELSMQPSVKLRLRLTLLFFMEPTDMLVMDMLVTDMLVLDMPDMLVILMLLDMLPTAHLPAPTLLVLLLLPSPLSPVDMLVLAVMSPTPLELSMLPSVRLRPRLTLLSFMEPTDMLDTDM